MLQKSTLAVAVLVLVMLLAPVSESPLLPVSGVPVQAALPQAGATVIGSGTAASCQTSQAANALSAAVAAGGEISFNCGPSPVTMAVNTNPTDQTVVIDGDGRIALSGEDLRQIFYLYGAANLTLKNITLIDGNGFAGSAISVDSTLARATVRNSFLTSHDSGSSNGGAIYNRGTLWIENSNLGANRNTMNGGAIYNDGGTVTVLRTTLINNHSNYGGAIFQTGGTLLIDASAVRSNSAQVAGGGIHITGGTASVVNSTFYDNRAAAGGGIWMDGVELTLTNVTLNRNRADLAAALQNSSGIIRARNTIFAGSRNTADSAVSLNCDGPSFSSLGRNIVSDGSCLPNPSATDLMNTDPQLALFIADNGGLTRSFMPLSGSPAIDYALACPERDQRGFRRPIGPACDSGSVEFGWAAFLPVVIR